MTPGAASTARDQLADDTTADLRWPPSAADLDAIACIDARSVAEAELRDWLRRPRQTRSSDQSAVAAALQPPLQVLPTVPRWRRARWAVAAALAILAVATPTILRTRLISELTPADPARPTAAASVSTGNVAAPAKSGTAAPAMVDRVAETPEPARAPLGDSPGSRRTEIVRSARPVVSETTRTSAPPLRGRVADAPLQRGSVETPSPAPRDIPPAVVPAPLAHTGTPSPSLGAGASTLASAVTGREAMSAPPAPRAEPSAPAASPMVVDAATSRAAPALPSPGADVASVREALSRYGAAYSRLDAAAARAVWPSVDARALERAFAELRSQRVTFENCDIAVDGSRARAACRGAATYVPRVGDQHPRTESRAWRFELEKGRDANWRIATANISVPRVSTPAR